MTRTAGFCCVIVLALCACDTEEKKAAPEVAPPAQATPADTSAPPEPAPIPKAATLRPSEPAKLTVLTLDPASSKLRFKAAKITRSHEGSFQQFTGTASLSGDEVQRVSFEVDTASLQTDSEKLTAHVKTEDFLHVEKYPKATFTSTQIVAKPSGAMTHELTGYLSLRGVTLQISFPAAIQVTPDAITGRAEVAINRKRFGVSYLGMSDDLIKDEVVLKPEFTFPRNKS